MIRDTFGISEISEPFDFALFAKCPTSALETDVRCSSDSSFLLTATPPLNLQVF